MHPEEIKAAIRMSGTTPARIADELEVARSTVSQVIHGKGVSARVRKRIAAVTGHPVEKLWPPEPRLRREAKEVRRASRVRASA